VKDFPEFIPTLRYPPSLLIKWVSGALSPGVKQQELEADHSPPSSVEVKEGGAIPALPICLHGIVLNKLSTGTTSPSFI
jgi:hypothetical protein